MVGDVLDLLGGECVVDADRRPARVDDAEVGDDVLGRVAGHDQPELPGAKTQRAEGKGHGGHLVAVTPPRQGPRGAVLLPVPRGLVAALRAGFVEARAYRLPR